MFANYRTEQTIIRNVLACDITVVSGSLRTNADRMTNNNPGVTLSCIFFSLLNAL